MYIEDPFDPKYPGGYTDSALNWESYMKRMAAVYGSTNPTDWPVAWHPNYGWGLPNTGSS